MASPKPSPNSAGYRLKITLAWSEPPIWRTFCIPNNITFDRLHDLVQVVMGWEDCHLHHFKVGRRFIGIPDPDGLDDGEIEDECTVTVTKIFNEKGSSVEYEYDFGDGWIHEITSLGPMEKDDRFYQVLDGARACPPEDCGGIGGYDQLIETLANPKHPEHKELKDWAGDDFDPEHFDRDKLNRTISAMIG